MSVSGIHRLRGGYQPLGDDERCDNDMEKRFRVLRRRTGKRSSLSGWIAAAVMWFVRPLFPSWRERVRRIRQEMIDRVMPRYIRRRPPPGMLPPNPPPGGGIVAAKIASGAVIHCAPHVRPEPPSNVRWLESGPSCVPRRFDGGRGFG